MVFDDSKTGTLYHTDYGRPVKKLPSLHGQKSNPTPKFLGTAEAYFFCHIGPIFQICLIFVFIGCPQSVSKAKGLWEWPLKVSGPFDYFRIEGQNFTGFWSISHLFYRLWKKEFDCTYCSTHRAYKNSQEIDLKVLKTSKILIFNPKII